MNLQETTFGPKTYLVWRKEIDIKDVADLAMWAEAFGKVHGCAWEKDMTIVGPGTALYFSWDEAAGRTEIGIGNPVAGADGVALDNPELSLVAIPESKAVHGIHVGTYDGLKPLHDALMAYMKERNLSVTYVVEEYTVDPTVEPDSSLWETNVYYGCE